MALEDVCLWWLLGWVLAAPFVWVILCCCSADALGRILVRLGPPTALAIALALLGWSFRSEPLDRFVFPVLAFCASAVATAGALRGFRHVDRTRRARRWFAGSLIATYMAAQGVAYVLVMPLFTMFRMHSMPQGPDERLGDGYFHRESIRGHAVTSDVILTRIVRVPPLLPFLEQEVAHSWYHVDSRSVVRSSGNGGGGRQFVVTYDTTVVDRISY